MKTGIELIIEKLESLKEQVEKEKENSNKIVEACRLVGRAWSGSSLAGHAKFFYGNFEEPDAYHRFSIEWGLINGIPEGWAERNDEEVIETIEKISGQKISRIREYATEIEQKLTDLQREVVLALSDEKKEVERVETFSFKSATSIFNEIFPTRYMTRDSEAMTGHYIVPHIYYQAIAMYVKDFPEELKRFIFEIKKAVKTSSSVSTSDGKAGFYVENSTILQLAEIKSEQFDLTRLIKLCKELNDNYSLGNYLSCGMILRSILDHIPPIFKMKSFEEVSSNYGSRSFKDVVKPLQESTKKIADSYLHTQIRKKEILPTKTQISFQPNLDFLLQEIIRIIK
ncbi:MAG: hypothetical protein PHI53_03325 [Candidatus Pacebacteria bacterium]|nr:hypothetical protein [Candidatus Paceibacterota bacterium]